MQKKSGPIDKNDRRRGRPAGKNRTPLSVEERRARNAQYERERRNETADAMLQLAEAACCDPNIANAELLATVISQLQRRAKKKLPQEIEDLKLANENLESQIAELQSRLGHDGVDEITDDLNECDLEQLSETHSHSDHLSWETKELRSRKVRKTSKSSSVHSKGFSESISEASDSSESSWFEPQKTSRAKHKQRGRRRKRSVKSETESDSSQTRPLSVQQGNSGKTQSVISSERENFTGNLKIDTAINVKQEINEEHGDVLEITIDTATKIKEEIESENLLETTLHGIQTSVNGQFNDPFLPAISELKEERNDYEDQSDTLTEAETNILNDWLDCSDVINRSGHSDNNRVKRFLDYDDFLTGF